jgi:hypothetical protein
MRMMRMISANCMIADDRLANRGVLGPQRVHCQGPPCQGHRQQRAVRIPPIHTTSRVPLAEAFTQVHARRWSSSDLRHDPFPRESVLRRLSTFELLQSITCATSPWPLEQFSSEIRHTGLPEERRARDQHRVLQPGIGCSLVSSSTVAANGASLARLV